MQLLETLSRWRHTEDEGLGTQLEVFHESYSDDTEAMSMPGGVDITSHEDMFNALYAKVTLTHYYILLLSQLLTVLPMLECNMTPQLNSPWASVLMLVFV